MTMVAEGIPTATSAQGCARRLGVETPIIDEVVSLLHAEKSASEGMHALLSRELRSEE
jgi:glycerol-3-phosphate dehydrogenase